MYLRSSKNYFQNVSLNDPIATDKDGSEITLLDAIAAPVQRSVVDSIVLEDRVIKLKKYLHVLDPRELEIITRRLDYLNRRNKHKERLRKKCIFQDHMYLE